MELNSLSPSDTVAITAALRTPPAVRVWRCRAAGCQSCEVQRSQSRAEPNSQ